MSASLEPRGEDVDAASSRCAAIRSRISSRRPGVGTAACAASARTVAGRPPLPAWDDAEDAGDVVAELAEERPQEVGGAFVEIWPCEPNRCSPHHDEQHHEADPREALSARC